MVAKCKTCGTIFIVLFGAGYWTALVMAAKCKPRRHHLFYLIGTGYWTQATCHPTTELHHIPILLLRVFLCAHIWESVSRGQAATSGVSLRCHSSCFGDRIFSLTWNSPSRLDWQVSRPQGCPCLCLPMLGWQACATVLRFPPLPLTSPQTFSGDETWVLCLWCKHFRLSNSAVPNLLFYLFFSSFLRQGLSV